MSRGAGRTIVRGCARSALTAAALFGAAAAPAHAYTISSAISSGCHEQITTAALRAVRQDLTTAAPLRADENEQALIDDVGFPVPGDLDDLGGVTLLLGVRDNDLKGRQANDITQLALVHGDPALQREHCLRSSDDDEPGGSQSAVAACRDFIHERIGQALAGLDATGAPDAANRTSLSVYLALRHRVDAPLPTYYLRIGQAIHALEDSFTHTFRTADGMQITTALNWVDEASGTLDEQRDGPPHASDLDRCDDADDLRAGKHRLATEAATALLRATLDPARSNADKAADADAVLDQYLGYAPGCSFDNGWCQAPERKYGNGQAFGCSLSGRARPASLPAAVALLALGLARRRRRTRSRSRGRARAVALACLAAAALASPARADAPDDGRAAGPDPGANASSEKPAAPPPANAAPTGAWGGYLGGSGSFDYGALAAALGGRFRASRHWTLGLDAEWNPWFSVNGASSVRAGAFNGYATAILRIPLRQERFDLRTTANLGVSTLLIDLYGAPKWSTGLFMGLSPLGVEWAISPRLFLIFNPLGYALPIPQLHGIPFAFPQYRATVGLELYSG
jgi:hypothetical protein